MMNHWLQLSHAMVVITATHRKYLPITSTIEQSGHHISSNVVFFRRIRACLFKTSARKLMPFLRPLTLVFLIPCGPFCELKNKWQFLRMCGFTSVANVLLNKTGVKTFPKRGLNCPTLGRGLAHPSLKFWMALGRLLQREVCVLVVSLLLRISTP
jgi:hypothetical protein